MTSVSGKVYDSSGALAAGRIVRAYRRDTGSLITSTVSGDGVDIPGDAIYADVSLLMNFDQSSFTDQSASPKTITATGTSAYTEAQKRFGLASYEGASDRHLNSATNAAFAIGTGDFTVEAWIRRKSGTSPTSQTIFNIGTFSSGLMFRFQNNLFDVYVNNVQTTRSATMANDVWYHVAICRSGASLRFFLDGVQLGATITNSANIPQGAIRIGASAHVSSEWFNGFIDDLRFTRAARYTANFTPPARAFPATASDTPNPLGEYLIDCGSFSGEVNVICLDDDAGTLENDLIHRAYPV